MTVEASCTDAPSSGSPGVHGSEVMPVETNCIAVTPSGAPAADAPPDPLSWQGIAPVEDPTGGSVPEDAIAIAPMAVRKSAVICISDSDDDVPQAVGKAGRSGGVVEGWRTRGIKRPAVAAPIVICISDSSDDEGNGSHHHGGGRPQVLTPLPPSPLASTDDDLPDLPNFLEAARSALRRFLGRIIEHQRKLMPPQQPNVGRSVTRNGDIERE